MDTLIQFCLDHLNYWTVTLFMAIESSFIPFPSEAVVPPAAWKAAVTGEMNIFLVVIFATLGALIGALINYYVAVWFGRPIVYKFANSRFGHMCLIDEAKVHKAEVFFDKHGVISTLIGRLVPVVRQLISIPAGLARMGIGRFVLYTTIGAGIWNIVLAGLGYWLSLHVSREELFDAIEKYNSYLTYAGYAIGVFCVAYILWNAFKTKKNN